MGWRAGEGLGKQGQGISRPIQVTVRPKQAGLGIINERTEKQLKEAADREAEKKGVKGGNSNSNSTATTATEYEPGWRRRGDSRKKPPKKVYQLPTDTTTTPSTATIPLNTSQQPSMVITDMRGEAPRVITNISDISQPPPQSQQQQQQQQQGKPFYMPELQHNLRLIVDLKEADILNMDRKKHSEQDRMVKLKENKNHLQTVVQTEADRIARMKEIMDIIGKCNEKIMAKQINLQSLAKVFLLFQKKYPVEYSTYKLYTLASGLAYPLLKVCLLYKQIIQSFCC